MMIQLIWQLAMTYPNDKEWPPKGRNCEEQIARSQAKQMYKLIVHIMT